MGRPRGVNQAGACGLRRSMFGVLRPGKAAAPTGGRVLVEGLRCYVPCLCHAHLRRAGHGPALLVRERIPPESRRQLGPLLGSGLEEDGANDGPVLGTLPLGPVADVGPSLLLGQGDHGMLRPLAIQDLR